jgi:PAS domain S-box-containing protein
MKVLSSSEGSGVTAPQDELTAGPSDASANLHEALQWERLLRKEAETLASVAQELAGELELQPLLQKIVDLAAGVTTAQFAAYVDLSDERPPALCLMDGVAVDDEAHSAVQRLVAGMQGLLADEGYLQADDIPADPRFHELGEAAARLGVRSCLAATVVGRQARPHGVLLLGRRDPMAFTGHSQRLLRAIAALAGGLIDNALRFKAATDRIEHQAQIEQAHRDSEQRFSQFMQHLPGLAWIKDVEGRYVFVNDAAARAFQRSKEELYGRRDSEVFPKETAYQFTENDRHALMGNEGVETIETLDHADGVHHSLVSKFPIPGPDGAPAMIGGIAIDVTERVRAEQALRNSEERFRAVTLNAPVAIYIKDAAGRYTLCNPLAADALGRPGEDVAGLTDHDLLPADAADRLRQCDLDVMAGGEAMEFEDVVPAGGVERQFLSVKFPLRNTAGEVVGVGGVSVDMTERKETQQALRDSERRLLLATQAGKVGVWAWDIEADRVSWSESLQNMLGIGGDGLAGFEGFESFESLVHPDDRERVHQAIERAVTSDVPLEIELRAVRPDGQEIWLFSNAAVLREEGRAVRMLGAVLDITERKRGELALRESEERFRTLASHAPVGIFQSDLEGNNQFVNEGWCKMAGMTPDEARGAGWASAIHPDDRERVLEGWQEAVADQRSSSAEFRFMRPDGVVTWLQGNAVPLRDAAGQMVGYIGTIADITARKEAEAALRNSERMYRAIGESIDYGIWVCDAEGHNIYTSDSFLKLVGIPQEECSGLGWCNLLHPDDVDQTIVAWKQCVATGAAWDVEHRFRGVDGKWHPVLARGVPVRNDRGEIIAWVGINLDISELKEVEHELRESEARFRNMADNAPVLIWVHGVGGCQYVNKEYMRFVGGSLSDVQGMNWTNYIHRDDLAFVDTYREAFDRHQPIVAQYRFRRADGDYRWLSVAGAPRFRPDGAFLGYVGCSVDITDIKNSEAALREADRRKDDFLAMLGHELRNPLAGIVTGAQVLSMLQLDSEAAEMQAVIARQATYMSRIVDDLLDVSRIARGKLRLRHQYANLRQLLQDTVDDYRKSRALDQCELRVNIPDVDLWVWADPARLAQAFSNIIHNGYKFSDGPNVISIELAAHDEHSQAKITVRDRGIGMTPEMLARIFEPFNQADTSLERNRGGLGLGLALTRGLIRLHGGQVTATSEGLGRGSVFTIQLPCVPAPKGGGPPPPPPASSTCERILIIDDRRDALIPLSKMLQMEGHVVVTAQDGRTGVVKATEFMPHVVLCDIGLPGEMNGYEVSRALRDMPETRSTYLVAVTGYGHDEAKRMARDAGFDYHLTKPLSKQQIREVLSRRPRF